MVARSRWTKKRLAKAAYLAGTGMTEYGIARHRDIGSSLLSVKDQLRAIGIVAQPENPDLERLVPVPASCIPVFAAIARAHGKRERPEEIMAALLAVIAKEPTLAASVLDDDETGFGFRISIEMARMSMAAEEETRKVARSVVTKRAAAAAVA